VEGLLGARDPRDDLIGNVRRAPSGTELSGRALDSGRSRRVADDAQEINAYYNPSNNEIVSRRQFCNAFFDPTPIPR